MFVCFLNGTRITCVDVLFTVFVLNFTRKKKEKSDWNVCLQLRRNELLNICFEEKMTLIAWHLLKTYSKQSYVVSGSAFFMSMIN